MGQKNEYISKSVNSIDLGTIFPTSQNFRDDKEQERILWCVDADCVGSGG